MPVFKAIILNKEINLNYKIDEKQKLEKAVEEVNNKLKKYDQLKSKINDSKILSLLAIELQDQIYEMKEIKNNTIIIENNLQSIQKKNINLNDQNIRLKKKIDVLEKEKIDFENDLEHIKSEVLKIIQLVKKNYEE